MYNVIFLPFTDFRIRIAWTSCKMGTANAQTNPEHGNDDTYINGSSIEAFFAESVILLTGATGFLGKALLEKLLRSCPRLATIFILIRPKQGQTTEQRYKRLVENPVRNILAGLFSNLNSLNINKLANELR